METKKMHPSVQKFKEFVRKNPPIIQEVRKGKVTWQELYEDWYLLGEDDSRWETLVSEQKSPSNEKEKEKKSDWMSLVMATVKDMDPNLVQNHLQNLSQAIGAVQGLFSQFQAGKQQMEIKKTESPSHPFAFRKD